MRDLESWQFAGEREIANCYPANSGALPHGRFFRKTFCLELCSRRREVRFFAFPLSHLTLLSSNLLSRLWCNGSTADSKPVSQGSNPWGRAIQSCGPTATTPVLHAGDDGSIPSETTVTAEVRIAFIYQGEP